MNGQKFSRRNFIKGSALLAAATGGLALAGCAAQTQPPSEEMNSDLSALPETWNYETDVVVVGTGSIISAALRAHDAGLDVLVLEKHPTWFGGNHRLQLWRHDMPQQHEGT